MGLPGLEFEAGSGQAAVYQVGTVLDLLQLALNAAHRRLAVFRLTSVLARPVRDAR